MSQKLGQHFLKNKTKLKKIVDALELKEGDVVIEIGPGHGELTRELRSKNSELRIIAIEKDIDLASSLKLLAFRNKWQDIEVVQGDALKVLPALTKSQQLKTKSYKVVGNIPYYITGYLFRILGELDKKPSVIVFTIQKEVAERITAKPPRMNLLAASVQFWAEPKIISSISKKDFKPQPKVDSAIIRLTPDARKEANQNAKESENYYKFIRILFKQPRKTISNNLLVLSNEYGVTRKRGEIVQKLKKLGVNPEDRSQNLTIEQIIELSREFLE